MGDDNRANDSCHNRAPWNQRQVTAIRRFTDRDVSAFLESKLDAGRALAIAGAAGNSSCKRVESGRNSTRRDCADCRRWNCRAFSASTRNLFLEAP